MLSTSSRGVGSPLKLPIRILILYRSLFNLE